MHGDCAVLLKTSVLLSKCQVVADNERGEAVNVVFGDGHQVLAASKPSTTMHTIDGYACGQPPGAFFLKQFFDIPKLISKLANGYGEHSTPVSC